MRRGREHGGHDEGVAVERSDRVVVVEFEPLDK
jgi:hypothetical protein